MAGAGPQRRSRGRPRGRGRAAQPPRLGSPGDGASLPLFPEVETPLPAPPEPRSRDPGGRSALWLCLELDRLPLDAVAQVVERPTVVVEERSGRRVVICCDERAARAGVHAGLSRDGAWALCPDLHVLEREPQRELAALERLAQWAHQYTAVVSLAPPDALLLEVRGSLRLFGGLEVLRGRIEHGLTELGYSARSGVAPVPAAAQVLAGAGDAIPVFDVEALSSRIGRLPLDAVSWSGRRRSQLRGMGLHRLRDLWRLPRADLTRRIGPEAMAQLDRIRGYSPDPRETYEPPGRYAGVLDLGAEVRDATQLLAAARRLVLELCGALRARQCGVATLALQLAHADRSSTRLEVGCATPTRDPERLMALLDMRLERERPIPPCVSLGLDSGPMLDLAGGGRSLFETGTARLDGPGPMAELMERIRVRLGTASVLSLEAVPEHRPEQAWRHRDPPLKAAAADAPSTSGRARPSWLLASPELMELRDGRPWMQGPLVLSQGPERIESGWWDGDDVRRDYYIAQRTDGARLWIYRERGGQRRWFLHGLFG